MLGDVVDVFGKRFDKIDHDLAAKASKEQVVSLQIQVNSIEGNIRDMQHTRLHARVADLEEKAFGKARA